MSEEDYPCRAFNGNNGKDEKVIKRLIENAFKDFLSGKYWDWKYKLNPNFDPSLVAVAEKNGKVIGCSHWLLRKLRISGSVEVEAFLGGDIAVSPEYRGRGIGRSLLLFFRSSEAIRNKGAVLTYTFVNPTLEKTVHEQVVPYIPAPTTTISYFKLLSWGKLRNRVEGVNEKIKNEKERLEKLSSVDLKILFQLSNVPQLFLELNRNGIKVSDGDPRSADVVVTSDLSTLSILKKKEGRKRNLIWALLTRKLKIKGGLLNLFRFYRSFWLIEEIFSGKIM